MSKIYVTSVDEETGQCHGVGTGTDYAVYETFGMYQVDAEQSDKDGNWYLTDRCPMFTSEEKLQKAKDLKHRELKQEMETRRDSLKVSFDSDQFDVNEKAQANMNTLKGLFDLGVKEVNIRSTTEVTHTFSQEQCNSLALTMVKAVNDLYSEYWTLKDSLNTCQTIDEIENINWGQNVLS